MVQTTDLFQRLNEDWDLPKINILVYELIYNLNEIQDGIVIFSDGFYRINKTDIRQLLNILPSYPPQNVKLVIIKTA